MMEIVTGAMSTLLPKLAALVTDEYKLQRSLRGEIMFLKAELEIMQAILERLSEVPVFDKQVKIWARDVRELSYNIEDSIDTFLVHIDTHPSVKPHRLFRGFIDRSLSLLTTAKIRHRIGTNIKGIKSLVKEVAARRDRYKVDSIAVVRPTTTTIDPRLMGIYEDATKLVGLSGPREELAELLMEPEGMSKRQLKVISIVGVGGLGKTTLANVMYQQHRREFECHAFVSMSLKPDIKRILSSILRQVSEQGYASIETWVVEEIINKIRQVLEDKRYFIIIDDIWDKSAWTHIKCALIENNRSSRIITTSRVVDVATYCCSEVDGTIYKLKPLSHDNSKKLFYKRFFSCEDDCRSELKEILGKILKKCDGVPLAIITIASLLASKPRNTDEWYRVHNSIGSGLDKSPSVENMRKILSISYYDLPSHLKACLLYLSIFPEDYNILRDQLIDRWISEGLIPGKDVDTLYELGEDYFNELINRSMIQPEYIDTHGRVQACRVHDMVLDLITSLSYEENFVTVLHGQQSTNLPYEIRRLSLQNSIDEHAILQETTKLSHVRSLIVFPRATNLLPPLSSFHILRVLDLAGCQDLQSHQIDGLGRLFHLRCLVLKDTNIAKLPKEIGNLGCLQILDLRHTSISELPSTVIRLRKLVRLHIDASVKLPDGIGNMVSLQALSFIGVSKSPNFVKELGNLIELRMLHIAMSGTWHKSYEKPLIDSLCNLHKIQTLYIHVYHVSTEFMTGLGWVPQHLRSFAGGQLTRLPRWIDSSLLDLCVLDMLLSILQQQDLQTLGALRFLHCLRLTVVKIEPEKLVIGTDHAKFQCVAEFSFVNNAMGLIFVQRSMPRLENLELGFRVQETKDFDIGLDNLSSLKHVTIRMDCGGSRVSEVEAAEAAIWNTTNLNANHLRLDVIRHFEDNMIRDEEQIQVYKERKEEVEEEDEEEIVVDRFGPWGGNGGAACDIKVAPQQLESLTICSGTIVDALAFSYRDRNGRRHTTRLWGGVGGSVHTIRLGASEFVMEVSGTIGPFNVFSEVITSITLVTNVCSYGPFGQPQGTPFRTPVKKNYSIVGFFGRSGTFLDAVGVYVHPF